MEPGNQKSPNLSKYVSTQLSSYLKYIILCTKEQGEHHVFEIQKEQQFREKGRRRRKKNSREFLWFFCVKMVALVWLHSVTPLMSF